VVGSGGGFDGDAVAECGELGDVVAHPAFDVDPAGVVVGSEVVEASGWVTQQLPDDDKDGAGDRNQCLELAAAFDDAPLALAEKGVGPGGRSSGLAKGALQVRVALAGLAAACHGSGLNGSRAQFRPRHQVCGGGN
jgi:hypothetical protein